HAPRPSNPALQGQPDSGRARDRAGTYLKRACVMTRARLFIVEDEQIVTLDLEDRLAALGYSVVGSVADGESAIERVREQRPDLILMDIKLFGPTDGIDAAARIHGESDVPIIYLTAFGDDSTIERAKATDPYGYVLKPIEDRRLEIAIEIALYRHT